MILRIFILICFSFIVFWLLLNGQTTIKRAWQKIFIVIIFASTSLIISFPNLSDMIGRIFGIKRVTDIVVYAYILLSTFVIILLYQKIAKIELRQVKLIREVSKADYEYDSEDKSKTKKK